MDPLTLGLLGAGLGLGKSFLVDQPAANRDAILQSEKARYSPWTHIQPNDPKQADPFGSALQGGLTGATLGQGMQQADKMNGLMDSQKAMMDATAKMNGPMYQPGMGQGMYANSMPYGSPWLRMGY